VINSGAPPFFYAWGLMFVCIGLYFVAGRFLVKARGKQRTVYAVTDRRAIIAAGSSVTDQLLPSSGISVTCRRWRNHLTVIFGFGNQSFRGFNRYGGTRGGRYAFLRPRFVASAAVLAAA
jgi:hypothetical protein